MALENSKCRAKIQGDPLSTVLFCLLLGHAVRNIAIFSRHHQLSAFADDIRIAARNPRALTDAFNELGTAPTNIGLQVNTSKNEIPDLYTKEALAWKTIFLETPVSLSI